MNKEKKAKGGRPAGKTDSKRRKSSPPVNAWELINGTNVPQSGPTVFASEARTQARDIVALLRLRDSWDTPQQAESEESWIDAQPIPADTKPEPWTLAEKTWLFDWLGKIRYRENGYEFPFFAVRIPEPQRIDEGNLLPGRLVVRPFPHIQAELVDFARSVFTLGRYVLLALMDETPQGFQPAPVTFEQRPVSGRDALLGLAEMKEPPAMDKKRVEFWDSAVRLRRLKWIGLRRVKRLAGKAIPPASQIEISFRRLIRLHTARLAGVAMEIGVLEATAPAQLVLLRRYAQEFVRAGSIRIDFS